MVPISAADAKTISTIKGYIAKPPHDKRTVVVELNPVIADYLLKTHNTDNRPKKPGAINQYVKDMKDDNWVLSASSVIIVSKTGRLLNGQNRLEAIKRFGGPVLTHMSFGEPDVNYDYMDNGVKRTASDLLARDGVKNYRQVASAIRAANEIETGTIKARGTNVAAVDIKALHKTKYQGIEGSPYIYTADQIFHNTAWPQSIVLGIDYLLRQRNQMKADEFFMAWQMGNKGKKYQALVNMQKYIDSITSKIGRVDAAIRKAALITAWNLFIVGKAGTAKSFEWNPKHDDFPDINYGAVRQRPVQMQMFDQLDGGVPDRLD